MFTQVRIGLAFCLAFAPGPLSAADRFNDPSLYEVGSRTDWAITGSALALSALPYLFESSVIKPRCPCPPEEVPGWERGVIGNNSDGALLFTDVGLTLAVGLPVLFNWIELHRNLKGIFWEDMFVYLQVLAINGALVSLTKALVQRPLPRSYSGDPAFVNSAQGYRSFYSGHASVVTAALTATAWTVHWRHGRSAWPWLILAGAGTAVAAGRVLGGVHFPSDVVVGFVTGAAIGTVVPLLHRRNQTSESNHAWVLVPTEGGASAQWIYRL